MAVLRDRMGTAESELELPAGARVRDLIRVLSEERPDLAPYWQTIRFALEEDYLGPDDSVPEGEVIYAIPPVSGGV